MLRPGLCDFLTRFLLPAGRLGARLTQHKSGLRLADLTHFWVRHGSSMFFRQRLRLPVSRRTIRRRAEPLSQPLRGTWREARGPKGQAQRTPMDSATSRPGRRPRRRHDGVDADCAGAAEPSRGGNCCAAGHRYRATVAAVSWLVAGTRRPAFGPRPTRPDVTWMRDERGFTPSTVEQWGRTTRRFLRWCAEAGRQLGDLTAGASRQPTWSRHCERSWV